MPFAAVEISSQAAHAVLAVGVRDQRLGNRPDRWRRSWRPLRQHHRTAGGDPGGRCASITADGSTAATGRSRGSYEPVPAPTFTTGDASPSAVRSAAV